MAVAIDTSASAKGTNVTSLSVSIAVAANANRALYGFACASDDPIGDFTSPVFNTSETLSALDTITNTFGRMTAYRRLAPSATTANMSVSYANSGDMILAAVSLYNVDQTTPEGAITKGADNTTPHTLANNNSTAGGIVLGGAELNHDTRSAHTITSDGAPQVLLTEQENADDWITMSVAYEPYDSGGVTLSWTETGDIFSFDIIAVPVNASRSLVFGPAGMQPFLAA